MFNQARFIRSLERGTPFIVNTRIQWIDLLRSGQAIPIVELVPDTENLISFDNNKDITTSSEFIFVDVPNTDHASILNFAERPYIRKLFIKAP